MERLVDYAHRILSSHLKPSDIAIDATVGNGYDMVFLAQAVGSTGKVYGFDIQEIALEMAGFQLKSKKCYAQAELILKSHAEMLTEVPESEHGHISLAMFNLGYLPHGDKSLTTQPDTSIRAMEAATELLKPQGVISILAYRGHMGGMEEFETVQHWIQQQTELNLLEERDSEHPENRGPIFWILQKVS